MATYSGFVRLMRLNQKTLVGMTAYERPAEFIQEAMAL